MAIAFHPKDVGSNPTMDSYIFDLKKLLFYLQIHNFASVPLFGDVITYLERKLLRLLAGNFKVYLLTA